MLSGQLPHDDADRRTEGSEQRQHDDDRLGQQLTSSPERIPARLY